MDRIQRFEPAPLGGDDFGRVGGPDDGLGAVIGLRDVAVDGALQLVDGAEDDALEPALSKLGEEGLKAKPVDEGRPKHVDIAVPAFGYRNHAAIDRPHGFIRGWSVTDAATHDGAQLKSKISRNTGSRVWADTAYRSRRNEAWPSEHSYVSAIHPKKPKGRPMSKMVSRAKG